MKTRKSLLLLAGVLAIVALLAATDVFARSSCTSETTTHATGNFIVNVAQITLNGRTSYTYTMSSPIGKNPNKFFIYVKDGLEGNLVSSIAPCATLPCPGVYVDHNEFNGSFPPAEVWKVNGHQDGVVFPAVAIDKVITLDVPERLKPEESTTTVLLGIGTTYEHCGPIFGPTTPATPSFQGSPLVTTTARLCFANGCCYNATVGVTDNIINSMTTASDTPNATVSPFEACTVTNSPNICEIETGLTFCPPQELGRPPMQDLPGGTCYTGSGTKYAC